MSQVWVRTCTEHGSLLARGETRDRDARAAHERGDFARREARDATLAPTPVHEDAGAHSTDRSARPATSKGTADAHLKTARADTPAASQRTLETSAGAALFARTPRRPSHASSLRWKQKQALGCRVRRLARPRHRPSASRASWKRFQVRGSKMRACLRSRSKHSDPVSGRDPV